MVDILRHFPTKMINAKVIFVIIPVVLLAGFLLYIGQERQGTFSKWSAFSPCTESCGGGVTYRKRTCIGSGFHFGLLTCSHLGKEYEVLVCNDKPCPVNGGFGSWSQYSDCSKSCGGGTKFRFRNCINPPPMWGGKNCSDLGKYRETIACNEHQCPINGGYSSWSSWSECSKTCGSGEQKRSRKCDNPSPKHGGEPCTVLGAGEETKVCSTNGCPVDGSFGEWEAWGKCDAQCGNGKRERIRKCNNPAPQNGGKDCVGSDRERDACMDRPCKVDGAFGEWEAWGKCDVQCGNGKRERIRKCNNPAPKNGGKHCVGSDRESDTCFEKPCKDEASPN